MRLCCALLLSLLALTSHGLASGKKPSPKPLSSSQTAQAYALLWSVASKNKDVDKILAVKTAQPGTTAVVRKIATFYGKLVGKIEPLKVGGIAVPDLKDGLPPAEQQARDAIETETTTHLLAASGPPFDEALLDSQTQALTYTRSLLAVLVRNSNDRNTRSMLEGFQSQTDALLQEVYKLQEQLVAK